jgi:serine protease Do
VERGSPAARAGLRAGDQVLAINGDRVDSSRALVRGIAAVTPGQTVRLSILRDGRPTELPVQVGRRPAQPQG